MTGTVQDIKTKGEFDTLIKGNEKVLIDFYADWCGPCRQIAPKIAKMAEEFCSIGFGKVNVDEVEEVSEEYKVEALPTFIVFVNGKEAKRIVGASEEKVKAALT